MVIGLAQAFENWLNKGFRVEQDYYTGDADSGSWTEISSLQFLLQRHTGSTME
jgi:hypothetical protein